MDRHFNEDRKKVNRVYSLNEKVIAYWKNVMEIPGLSLTVAASLTWGKVGMFGSSRLPSIPGQREGEREGACTPSYGRPSLCTLNLKRPFTPTFIHKAKWVWALTDSKEWSDSRESDIKDGSCGGKAESGLSFSSFVKTEALGDGGYGYVYGVQHKIDHKLYAVKIVKYDSKADKEVRALACCEHPNIVRYITAWSENFDWSSLNKDRMSQQSSPNFSDEEKIISDGDLPCLPKCSGPNIRRCLFILMEFCEGGTLYDWIADRNCGKSKGTKYNALEVFQQVVSGVQYIHSKGFIHRDLKPANILFTAEGKVKIGDFGLATSATNQNGGILTRTMGKGTESYMSPEQMDKPDYDNKTDIFPLGLIWFELLLELTTGSERAKIWPALRNQAFPTGFCEKFSAESTLISKMLSKAPEKRPSAEKIMEYIKDVLLPPPSRERTV